MAAETGARRASRRRTVEVQVDIDDIMQGEIDEQVAKGPSDRETELDLLIQDYLDGHLTVDDFRRGYEIGRRR